MSEFIVHSIPGSPFGRTVLAALEEKGAPLSAGAAGAGRHEITGASHPQSVRADSGAGA
jgi:glutathione S-transferase